MTDDELRDVVPALVFDVLELEMPPPTTPTPSGGTGHYWTVGDQTIHDNAEPLELEMAFFWDLCRRVQVKRLVEGRGLPAEVVRLAWDALPYESVPFRLGWQRWRE